MLESPYADMLQMQDLTECVHVGILSNTRRHDAYALINYVPTCKLMIN